MCGVLARVFSAVVLVWFMCVEFGFYFISCSGRSLETGDFSAVQGKATAMGFDTYPGLDRPKASDELFYSSFCCNFWVFVYLF